MKLKIKPFNAEVKQMYKNHGHFHHGDAGLDVFIVSKQTISAGDTALIHLQIACEPDNEQPYLLMPRSSIAKTPQQILPSFRPEALKRPSISFIYSSSTDNKALVLDSGL